MINIQKQYTKTFQSQDILAVQNYVIQKLKVRDIYKVKDRFEGNLFLQNVLAKYFIFNTLLSYIEFAPGTSVKIGFIATLNLEKLTGRPVRILSSHLEIKKQIIEENALYAVVNSERKICEIYSCKLINDILSKQIKDNILQYGTLIYVD